MDTTALPPRHDPATTVRRNVDRLQPLVDALAYVLLMFATALAVSVVLAGLVLLLASPAQAAARGEEAGVGGGRLFFRDRAGGDELIAPALHTDVLIQVSGPLAHTRVAQSFRNSGPRWLEGIYVFPLPEGAAVSRLRLRVGERVIEGEIEERSRASATYARAKDAGQRAALVEQERPNMFTTSVANIGPGEDVVVELEYRETLAYQRVDGVGRYRLRFPMVVGPRYVPGAGQVGDAERIGPPVIAPGAARVNPVSLHVRLDAGVPIEHVDSPYHAVEIIRSGETRRTISLADGEATANRDFVLDWTLVADSRPAPALFFEAGQGGTTYALLDIVPPAPAAGSTSLPREVVFVIDTSGSMEGESIEQAREALALALRRLRPRDRFNVIAFNHLSTALYASAEQASAGNIAHAVRWVERLRANGGTEMAGALEDALRAGDSGGRVRQVIFLTDGAVGNETQLFALIQRHLGASRLFTVGIGSAPNSFFMRKAAQSGRGSFTYIGKVDEVQEKMSELFARLEAPVLTNLRVRWPDGRAVETWPAALPDLYLGEPLEIAARLDSAEGPVVISGEAAGEPWQRTLQLAEAHPGGGIGSLWARRKIESLMDGLAAGRDEVEVRAEVIPLAIEHRLVSRYTSFVAVDRTPARPADAPLSRSALPTHLPHGWDHAAVFGELPRGATDARWHLLLGALSILAAALLLALRLRPPGRPVAA